MRRRGHPPRLARPAPGGRCNDIAEQEASARVTGIRGDGRGRTVGGRDSCTCQCLPGRRVGAAPAPSGRPAGRPTSQLAGPRRRGLLAGGLRAVREREAARGPAPPADGGESDAPGQRHILGRRRRRGARRAGLAEPAAGSLATAGVPSAQPCAVEGRAGDCPASSAVRGVGGRRSRHRHLGGGRWRLRNDCDRPTLLPESR